MFRIYNHLYGPEVGLQIFKSTLMLKLELLHKLIEFILRSADFLLKQFGSFLQVASDVTHRSFLLPYAVVEFSRRSSLNRAQRVSWPIVADHDPPLASFVHAHTPSA
jgi:hypothetical protein